jgi:hypothetical protein
LHRRAAALVLGLGALLLLLTPGAPGLSNNPVPGDPTPPTVLPVIVGSLGAEGWYTSNVTVSWTVVDPESLILSTTGCDTRTLNSDTVSTPLSCTAESDGGETTVSKSFKLDKTAPATSATASRGADANGWHNHDLSVSFSGTDVTSGLESCSAPQTYGGPDTTATSLTGTCRDRAGNTGTASFALKYDETPPQTTAAARAPDRNGWYNHAVTVGYQGTDATSGVGTCSQVTYAGPDDPSVALVGTCTDVAGNESGPAVFTLKYDETAPQGGATASRGPDVNGWFNHALTVSFGGSDAVSGLDSCDPAKTYSGPDAVNASVAGSCRDQAGNVVPLTLGFKYDQSAPIASATPSRQPNANGWYNASLTVNFSATDAVSGLQSCSAPRSYAGPDSETAAVSGTCQDAAGNAAAASFALKYDATAPQASATPSRQPNANGWYKTPVTLTFAGSDATSGVDTCDAATIYSGPDTTGTAVSGACRDRAGNSTGSSFALRYDATVPQVTGAASRGTDANGWYNHPLTVSFTGGDATSGVESCVAPRSYSGPDSASTAVDGTCVDRAGNVGSRSFALKYDATLPVVTAAPGRSPDENGWYNHSLTVSFGGTDATAGIASCDGPRSYIGPDSVSVAVSGACSDQAGNRGVGSFAFGYDATAPQVLGASPARAPDANGWYNAPLTLTFQGGDVTSGVQACTSVTYGGPDSGTASVSGSCRDRAGNQSGSSSFALSYDGTAPLVTAAPNRAVDANGWYNHPLVVSFTGGDATAGIESCVAPKSYAGPDDASAVVGGTCLDKAGNVGSASLALKYDATGPPSSATPSRPADANGWYNHALTVSFAASDPLSGLASCPGPATYSGPDSASAVVSGTCMDRAGNGSLASFAMNYDATAPQAGASPSRAPDSNGWYNHPFTVGFQGTDAVSGTDGCTAPQTYAGPDTNAASMSGSCRDRAGNVSASRTFELKYDATAPQVTGAVAGRGPDQAGWYNRAVAFTFLGGDATAGIDSCPAATYGGPDSASASVVGTCVDKAGNRGSRSFALRYDATGPEAVASADREPGSNGWYNRPLTVSFSGSDPISGLDGCEPPQSYQGPDGGFAVVGGTCFDKAGNVGLASLPLRYDATAPEVAGAVAARPPDSNGWYNRPLAVTFHGSDATSEIDACTVANYSGPDAVATTVSGSCRDRAGNGSVLASFALRYDSTPPSLLEVKVKPGNRSAVLSWRASPDTNLVEVVRTSGAGGRGTTVYRGAGQSFADGRLTNGTEYRYAVTAYDEARNSSTRGIRARPTAPLFAPAAGATVTAPPRLAWTPVANATYYNVQLWRNGKIFSAWPKRTSLKLRPTWTFEGRRYRLLPGRYRWYVWPGYGRRAAGKYGRPLGSSSFVVKR